MADITVLFLVMEFPPVNTTGNFRTLKFVKYLSQFGVKPVVVTIDADQASASFNAKTDNTLLEELPEGTIIYRAKLSGIPSVKQNKLSAFLRIFFKLNDDMAGLWAEDLNKILPGIIDKHKPLLLYTSLPPFSSAGLALKVSEKFGLPLVADMRDLWSKWGSNPSQTYIHYTLKKLQERKFFSKAAKIITATPQLKKIFAATHPAINPAKFVTITNGFDSDVKQADITIQKTGKFKIGYVGSFYYNPESHNNSQAAWYKRQGTKKLHYYPSDENWLYRSPYFFFKTLRTFLDAYPEFKNEIEFHFIGHEPAWMAGMIKEFNLAAYYVPHGFVSQAKALEMQRGFDVMLATSEKIEGDEHYCLPSKIFDYVVSNKPIIGFVTAGIQKEFIERSGMGIVCDPDSIKDGVEKLNRLINDQQTFSLNIEYLNKFKRQNLAEELADVFKELVH